KTMLCFLHSLWPSEQVWPRHAERRRRVHGPVRAAEMLCEQSHHWCQGPRIQMNVADLDKVTGWFNGHFETYAICGAIRRMGESDDSILRLAKADGIVSKNF
ncbi:40S ribosomal protein S21, partial [Sigmodon hispidus]